MSEELIEKCNSLAVKVRGLEISLDMLKADPHRFTSRGCPTCKNISKVMGVDFGCEEIKVRFTNKVVAKIEE